PGVAGARLRAVALARLRHRSRTGQWLAACQAGPGGGGARLPPWLRRAAAPLRRRHRSPQPPLLPLVQRTAGAAAAGDRDPGGRQAVLSSVAAQHKSVALPLALAYAALIVYASL